MDPLRGWMYVVYGPWLILFCILMVLFATQGSPGRRVSRLGAWYLVGLVLSVAVTHRRGLAEYQFQLAGTVGI